MQDWGRCLSFYRKKMPFITVLSFSHFVNIYQLSIFAMTHFFIVKYNYITVWQEQNLI